MEETDKEVTVEGPNGDMTVEGFEWEVAVEELERDADVDRPDGDTAEEGHERDVAVEEPVKDLGVEEPEGDVAVDGLDGDMAEKGCEWDTADRDVAVERPDGDTALKGCTEDMNLLDGDMTVEGDIIVEWCDEEKSIEEGPAAEGSPTQQHMVYIGELFNADMLHVRV